MSKVVLFSAFHKPYIAPKAKWVVPIHAGKALSKTDLSIQGDDTGDNISKLNPIYCELTVAYWIWKNADRTAFDYWGLMHYRRYLLPQTLWTKLGKRKGDNFPIDQTILDQKITEKMRRRIENDLKSYDIIVPMRRRIYDKKLPFISIKDHYLESHVEDHWYKMRAIILAKYPEYESSFEIFDIGGMYLCNMMIASWAVWDKYLEWLFGILFELESMIEIPDDPFQRRSLGFLSERLLNLYVHHNKLKVKGYLLVSFQ